MNIPATQPQVRSRGVDNPLPRILVVDDEQYMCDVCARTLQRSGYDVVTTSDPDAAMRLLNGELHFDLLLTDIKMPGMSGLDLANIAREQDPAIAIIIMTGFASKENLQQSVQRGVADFLSKPFELDQLRIAVDQALHKRSLLQDNLRLRALEHLLASSAALSGTLDLQELSATLLRVTMSQTECLAGFVLVEQTHVGVIASPQEAELLPDGQALARRAAASQRLVVESDLTLCRIGETELRHGLALALTAQSEVSGVLVLCHDQPMALRTGVQEELAVLANHAGAALRNAALYNQLGDAYTRLQELDRLKGEFIAVASHELRTPLSIVLGYAMMVRDQTGVDQHRDYMQRVLENAERIRDIVDDMVRLRHLDLGEANLAHDQVVLQELVRQAYEQMIPIARERQQSLDIHMPESPLAFLCDREKVLLVLGHLIANAVRFTPEGGSITIRVSQRPAGSLLEDVSNHQAHALQQVHQWPWALVEVQDTGIGIPERELSRIFQRFYQVADSLTRDHGGIGLGLAIVRELTAALGGEVWVTSSEGQGSTFTLALPCRQE